MEVKDVLGRSVLMSRIGLTSKKSEAANDIGAKQQTKFGNRTTFRQLSLYS